MHLACPHAGIEKGASPAHMSPPTENAPPPQRASGRRPPSVAERAPKLRAHRSAIRKSLSLQARLTTTDPGARPRAFPGSGGAEVCTRSPGPRDTRWGAPCHRQCIWDRTGSAWKVLGFAPPPGREECVTNYYCQVEHCQVWRRGSAW